MTNSILIDYNALCNQLKATPKHMVRGLCKKNGLKSWFTAESSPNYRPFKLQCDINRESAR